MVSVGDEGANLRPLVPEGARLAWSQENSDRRRALLFDRETGKLLGPAELIEVDESDADDYGYSPSDDEYSRPMTEEEREAAALIAAMAAVILIEVTKAAVVAVNTHVIPRVRRWWQTTARPGITKAWGRVSRNNRQEVISPSPGNGLAEIEAAATAAREIPPSVLSQQLEITIAEVKRAISPEEARQRQLAIQLAEAFIAEQQRVLAESEVVDPFFENVQLAVEQRDHLGTFLNNFETLRTSLGTHRMFGRQLQATDI